MDSRHDSALLSASRPRLLAFIVRHWPDMFHLANQPVGY
jgi:hypothetical protein